MSFFSNINSFITFFNCFLVFLLLEIDSCFVGVISELSWVIFLCLGVMDKSVWEVLLLVEVIALLLLFLSLFQQFSLLLLLIWQTSFFFFSFLSLFLFLSPFSFFFVSLSLISLLILRFGLIFLHGSEVETRQLLENVHKSSVSLNKLHHDLGVLFHHLELVSEYWV